MGGLFQLVVEAEIVAEAHRDFWAYAGMMLAEAERRSLEESCRKLGVVVSRLGPAAPTSPTAFCSVIKAARAAHGDAFVHHAGYFAGTNAARRVEANLPNPNAGAERLAHEAAAAWAGIVFEAKFPSPVRCEFQMTAGQPIDRALTTYVHGFVKGAAKRLNEGAPPALREATSEGGRIWTASVDWAEQSGKGTAPATRAGKTPRK